MNTLKDKLTPPVIVGAGPAGLAAAAEFIKAGVCPIILEENTRPGGQGTRRLARSLTAQGKQIFGAVDYREILLRQQDEDELLSRCDYRPDTLAWAIYNQTISTINNNTNIEVPYDRLLIATGAVDRIMAIEGWHLAGVYSLGAAQVALKAHASFIGDRIVFAGSSPLLYLAAAQYARLGMRNIVILDCTTNAQKGMAALSMSLYSLNTLIDGLKLIRELKTYGISIITGARLLKFMGAERVEAVHYNDKHGIAHEIACDSVAYGYGLKPETQLAELAGADFSFNEHIRLWCPRINTDGQANEKLWLAGDGAAIGGVEAAGASGKLAAFSILASMGVSVDDRQMSRLRKRVIRLRKFQIAMSKAFRWPYHQVKDLEDHTYVCRCERVTAGEIRSAIKNEIAHVEINRVKAITRCGMGRCQGRFCGQTLQELIIASAGSKPEAVGRLRAQAPCRPIAVSLYGRESKS